MNKYYTHETAVVDPGAQIGEGTKIWHFCHISSKSVIGKDCTLGQNVYIGPNVKIGDGVKIQNNVSVFEGVIIEDDVFIGPSVVFTNVLVPRAFIDQKEMFRSTRVKKGASIGANATIICGNEIGAYSFIGAGATISKGTRDYELWLGCPAHQDGWISAAGHRLYFNDNVAVCEINGDQYHQSPSGRVYKTMT